MCSGLTMGLKGFYDFTKVNEMLNAFFLPGPVRQHGPPMKRSLQTPSHIDRDKDNENDMSKGNCQDKHTICIEVVEICIEALQTMGHMSRMFLDHMYIHTSYAFPPPYTKTLATQRLMTSWISSDSEFCVCAANGH